MKSIFNYLLFVSSFLLIMSCSDDDEVTIENPDIENTIAQLIEEDPEFSNLLAALEAANLISDFGADGELTLFAPTNAAFTQFLESNGFASLGAVPENQLRDLLLNHVISGSNLSTDLSTGYATTFTESSASQSRLSIYIDTQEGVVLNGIAEVTEADIMATNGVVHEVNSFISIPSVATQVTANQEFSTLVQALQQAESETLDFIELLSNTGENSPFTLFAPTNAAFENLLNFLGLNSIQGVDPEILATILSYHVVTENNVRLGDLSTGLTADTFQGEVIEFNLSNGEFQVIDASNINANIVETDIQTDNGVVHSLDKVLLPLEILDIIDPTITGLALNNTELSSLVAALEYTGLDATLANRSSEFTVFAPNNAAFASYLAGDEITDLPVEVVRQVLLNHVLTGSSLSDEFETSYALTQADFGTTDNKISLYINTSNGVVLNGFSNVIDPDLGAANGIIHVVDEVIDLPTVVTFVSADPDFASLLDALTSPGQDFVDLLSTPSATTPAPFTVFAPTNQAFENLLTELGVSNIEDIDAGLLTASLSTHVVSEFNVRSADLMDGTITTLGSDLIVNTSNATLTDARGRLSSILSFDIQVSNGVIHAIDTVLLPEE